MAKESVGKLKFETITNNNSYHKAIDSEKTKHKYQLELGLIPDMAACAARKTATGGTKTKPEITYQRAKTGRLELEKV